MNIEGNPDIVILCDSKLMGVDLGLSLYLYIYLYLSVYLYITVYLDL